MKHFILTLLSVVLALVSLNVSAQTEQTSQKTIQFEKLVNMIANDAHWDEQNLINIGLEELVNETEEDEECGTFFYFICGQNVIVQTAEEGNISFAATGSHAFAIEVTLMTDNCTNLYFKEQGDHDEFLRCLRQSSEYVNNDGLKYVGISLIESDEFVNDWYVISFHGG